MRKNSGFTLIELVVVIVILGILAATAAPKFMDLQGDAKKAALQGMQGALKSAVSMTYSKAILSGADKAESGKYVCSTGSISGTTCKDGDNAKITLAYGRPTADENGIVKAIDSDIYKEAEKDKGDWWYSVSTSSGIIYIMPNSVSTVPTSTSDANGCGIIYTQATKDSSGVISQPKIEIASDGC